MWECDTLFLLELASPRSHHICSPLLSAEQSSQVLITSKILVFKMSRDFLLNIFIISSFLPPVKNFLNLSCLEASLGNLYDLRQDVENVYIENCKNLKLDIFKYRKYKISNLYIINVTNLTIVTGPQSLENIENIVLFQSTILENTNFVSKSGSTIFIENCDLRKNLKIYSMGSDLLEGRFFLR